MIELLMNLLFKLYNFNYLEIYTTMDGLTNEDRQEEYEDEEQEEVDMGDGNQQQQMDEEDEEDEEEGSPDDGMSPNNGENMNGGMNTDDYEEIDYKICGELGKKM
jgi:hypothetical protein